MSQYSFTIQKSQIYGSYGEFSVGMGPLKIRAKYLLTKISPGAQGTWENQLASQMVPWREIFQVEELSFDELIQRDLDDSRVAHDLIPYLLGDTGQHARFFPPVLAVLVPRKVGRSGIQPRYPVMTASGTKESYGDLFDFDKVVLADQVSPLGVISYNVQKTAMVIVDGQHRAMAVLALHRQLNKTWGSDPFAPYYNHIDVKPEEVQHIELPVCLIYFPDLTESHQQFQNAGIDLTTVCREIFTVVNKSAKSVSKSRELLLNDEDLAAFMMRRTLSSLKDRSVTDIESAKIYSFAFGDDENGGVSQVMAGQLEYCSAVALHKMHAATGFALPACFDIQKTSDVTDGRNVRNSVRPIEILAGVNEVSGFSSLGRKTGKSHSPQLLDVVVSKVGSITDAVMLPLFDQLRPFVCHNIAMRERLEALNDSAARADLIQTKCKSLLFDGSGNRHVFEEHQERLNDKKVELRELNQTVPAHLDTQIKWCDAVNIALQIHEEQLKLERAFKLFGMDAKAFLGRAKSEVEADTKVLRSRARSIFDTVSTQAFQIGYLMAVLSAVEQITPTGTNFDTRLRRTQFLSSLYLAGLNAFFAISAIKHKTLTGYVTESRAKAFDASEIGFRGLLAACNVRELNEKQWEFFRYVVLEIVHSRIASASVMAVLDAPEWASEAALYRSNLHQLLAELDANRTSYFDSAFRAAISAPDFRREMDLQEAKAKAAGGTDAEIKKLYEDAVANKKTSVQVECKLHVSTSLGKLESAAQILERLGGASAAPTASADGTEELDGVTAEPRSAQELDLAVATDELLNSPQADAG